VKPRDAIDTTARCTCAATPGRLCPVCIRLGNLGWPIGGGAGAAQAPAPDRGERIGADAAAAGEAEGADYARALLERIGTGTSSPADLAGLMQFLHSGALLHGAAAVIFDALRRVLRGASKP
jgi:hypothetical protein